MFAYYSYFCQLILYLRLRAVALFDMVTVRNNHSTAFSFLSILARQFIRLNNSLVHLGANIG